MTLVSRPPHPRASTPMRDLATDLTRGGAWPPLCDPTTFPHVCKVVGGLVLLKTQKKKLTVGNGIQSGLCRGAAPPRGAGCGAPAVSGLRRYALQSLPRPRLSALPRSEENPGAPYTGRELAENPSYYNFFVPFLTYR